MAKQRSWKDNPTKTSLKSKMSSNQIVGIKDFKRMTPEHQKSLVKMDGKNSPYSNTVRMNKTIQLLPLTDIFEITDKGKPYVQYTVFIRNSDWAEPME
jgi:hypothetical protein